MQNEIAFHYAMIAEYEQAISIAHERALNSMDPIAYIMYRENRASYNELIEQHKADLRKCGVVI